MIERARGTAHFLVTYLPGCHQAPPGQSLSMPILDDRFRQDMAQLQSTAVEANRRGVQAHVVPGHP